MANVRKRVEHLEEELLFSSWLRFMRWLETRTDEQLEEYISSGGILPDPFPDPPPGSSRLDGLDRKELIRLWRDDQRCWAGRTAADPIAVAG